jgi:hypothetical protein
MCLFAGGGKMKNDSLNQNKEIFVAENDEEVLNCEGGPCNFVYENK